MNQTGRACDWTLDLSISSRLSIREARLQTRQQLNVICGKNGCGKSQLLAIIHSYKNTLRDQYLRDQGYKNFFLKADSKIDISGPQRFYYTHPTRIIGKHPDERKAGAYTFVQVQEPFEIKERYNKFRLSMAKLIFETEHYHAKESPEHNEFIKSQKKKLLANISTVFSSFFPGLSLTYTVDQTNRTVSLFASRADMPFVRPNDDRFQDEFIVPFNTMSDGEMNALFLTYDLLLHAYSAHTPVLLLVDEIENHMHPALQVKFMQVLMNNLPTNAMVLATTHSPHIITCVPPESRILMVHSSEKDSTGNYYRNQLLSAESEYRLSQMIYTLYGADSAATARFLLDDIYRLSTAESLVYAQQCLQDSGVITTAKSNDPQRVALTSILHDKPTHSNYRILDVGAGEGRLIKGLNDDFGKDPGLKIEFDLLEANKKCRDSLGIIRDTLQGCVSVKNIYSNISEVADDQQYDLVLLHNVVHELGARSFASVLSKAESVLCSNGRLNILEQMVLPRGESRYFVFSPNEIALLAKKLGWKARVSTRTSHSGIDLYEITLQRTKISSEKKSLELIHNRLRKAIEATITENISAYATETVKQNDPVRLAFLAFNIANGHLWAKELQS